MSENVDSRDHHPTQRSRLHPFQLTLRELMAATAVVALVAGLTSYMMGLIPKQHQVNISREEAPFELPEGGSNVSYALGSRMNRAYEFNIDEEGFLRWAELRLGSPDSEKANASLENITTPFFIDRYTYMTGAPAEEKTARITRGYSRKHRGLRIAYDLDTQTAYVCSWESWENQSP